MGCHARLRGILPSRDGTRVLRLLHWQAVDCLPPEPPPEDAPRPAGQQTWSCPQHWSALYQTLSAGRPAFEYFPGQEAHHLARRVFFGRLVLLEAPPHSQGCPPPAPGSVREAAPALRGQDAEGCKVLGAPGSPFQSRRLPRGCPELQGPQLPSQPLPRLPALAVLTSNVARMA